MQDSESQDGVEELAKKSPPHWLMLWGPLKRWAFYRKTCQDDRESYNFWQEHDARENEKGRLPSDEGVQVPAIWVTELYTPSTVGGLLKGLVKLGWEYDMSRDASLTKWMNDVREGRSAGWISLGTVSPPDVANLMDERTAQLPEGATAALPVLMSITPSITAFIIVFFFDGNTASSLEVPLRSDFAACTRRDSRFRPWHVIRYVLIGGPINLMRRTSPPGLIRRNAVKASLKELESDCVEWVRSQLPGAFAALPCSLAPTAILLVTEHIMPLSEEARGVRAFDGLAINRAHYAWRSDQWPGARLLLPCGWDEESKRLVFTCRRHDAFLEDKNYQQSTSNLTIAYRSDDFIRGILSRWAITCLLDSYHEALAEQRDRVAHDGRYRLVRDLKELRSLVRTMFYDIGACTKEVIEFTESDLKYRHDVLDMFYVREIQGEQPELLKDLIASQNRQAKQVQREAELLSSMLSSSNNLTQTVSSIRTQRLVIFLTAASAVFAGIAAWLASVPS